MASENPLSWRQDSSMEHFCEQILIPFICGTGVGVSGRMGKSDDTLVPRANSILYDRIDCEKHADVNANSFFARPTFSTYAQREHGTTVSHWVSERHGRSQE